MNVYAIHHTHSVNKMRVKINEETMDVSVNADSSARIRPKFCNRLIYPDRRIQHALCCSVQPHRFSFDTQLGFFRSFDLFLSELSSRCVCVVRKCFKVNSIQSPFSMHTTKMLHISPYGSVILLAKYLPPPSMPPSSHYFAFDYLIVRHILIVK